MRRLTVFKACQLYNIAHWLAVHGRPPGDVVERPRWRGRSAMSLRRSASTRRSALSKLPVQADAQVARQPQHDRVGRGSDRRAAEALREGDPIEVEEPTAPAVGPDPGSATRSRSPRRTAAPTAPSVKPVSRFRSPVPAPLLAPPARQPERRRPTVAPRERAWLRGPPKPPAHSIGDMASGSGLDCKLIGVF